MSLMLLIITSFISLAIQPGESRAYGAGCIPSEQCLDADVHSKASGFTVLLQR